MTDAARIIDITLDESTILRRTPEVEHERNVAIADLLEGNYFAPAGFGNGPYRLTLRVAENRLLLDILREQGEGAHRINLPLSPFRSVIRDYFMICESYYEAIKTATPDKIEAIDMGRRGLHNEAANLLIERLKGKVSLNENTARRLFTLICVLHLK